MGARAGVGVGISVGVEVGDGSKVGVDLLLTGATSCVGNAVPAGEQLARKTSKSNVIRI